MKGLSFLLKQDTLQNTTTPHNRKMARVIPEICDWFVLIRMKTIKKRINDNDIPRAIHVMENTLFMINNRVSSRISNDILETITEHLDMALYMCYLNVPDGAIKFIDKTNIITRYNVRPDQHYLMQSRLNNNKDVGTLACLPNDIMWSIGLLLTA